jgi:hypothetical protein
VVAVIDRGIKAAGGEARLKKLRAATWKGKGTFQDGAIRGSFTLEATVQGLDQFRMDFAIEYNRVARNWLLLFNKARAWGQINQMVLAFPKEINHLIRADNYALRLAHLLYPLKDKACKLTSLGELQVDGIPAVGVKVRVEDILRTGCSLKWPFLKAPRGGLFWAPAGSRSRLTETPFPSGNHAVGRLDTGQTPKGAGL